MTGVERAPDEPDPVWCTTGSTARPLTRLAEVKKAAEETTGKKISELECLNAKTCTECATHWCCRIFNRGDKPGTRDHNMWFEDWCDGFHPHPETYGVNPLFDPLEVWMDGPEHDKQRQELMAKGIDPEYCQYYSRKSGCMIERARRPVQCRQFNCGSFMVGDYLPMQVATP